MAFGWLASLAGGLLACSSPWHGSASLCSLELYWRGPVGHKRYRASWATFCVVSIFPISAATLYPCSEATITTSATVLITASVTIAKTVVALLGASIAVTLTATVGSIFISS